MVGLATCGGEAGGGPGWWLERRRERGREKTAETGGRGASFWPTLNPIVSLPQAINPPLFIGGEKGQSCLH